MSISYSGLTSRGKVTLPSVGNWGNLNILRDPPKSIHTRRIQKVGDDSQIIDEIGGSGNRICEAINHYARGVNPMVSVQYSNTGYGGNGTSSIGTGGKCGTNAQAFLPYRIMNGGAFRPPIQRQEDLLPLSRLPRLFTCADTNKQLIDY